MPTGHDLEECFASAQCGELVRRDGSRAIAINKPGFGKRNRRAAQKSPPTLLVFSGALSERHTNSGVLCDLLGQAGIHSSEISQALSCDDTHHAGLARASQKRDDVPSLASEGGKFVDDNQASAGSLCRDAHQVEQNPRADLVASAG